MKEKTYYQEAKRYMDNAKESLAKTTIKEGFYEDEKYVKQAAGIAYAGLEKSARWYLRLQGYKQPLNDNNQITFALAKFNKTAQKLFYEGYEILHKAAYYRDFTGVEYIKVGLNYANKFIELLQPYKTLLESENGSNIEKKRSLRRNK